MSCDVGEATEGLENEVCRKRHSPTHSEIHSNGPETKISYIFVCLNPNTFLVRLYTCIYRSSERTAGRLLVVQLFINFKFI